MFLLPCLAVALLVRIFFFNGPSLHDDVNYWMQSIATGLDNSWPPPPTHWHTRIGFVLPCALLIKIFGLKLWTPYLFTMLGGMLEVALTYLIAREFVSEKAARLATWLCAFFPLNILYSSYLYVDLWSGLLGALSLFFWYRALRSDHARDFALASFFVGLSWLFRETVVMLAPIFLALWVQAGRWRRPKIFFALPPALLLLGGEMLLYQITAHNWHYRFDAIFDSKAQMLEDVTADGSFLFTPLKLLLTSHELGLFLVMGLIVAATGWRRVPTALVLWLGVGFAWFSWGTTTPGGWVTMQRDPRYLSVLTIPCVTLLAAWLTGLRSGFWRCAFLTVLVASGIFGAALDLGSAKLSACRAFLASEFNREETTLEPNVYFGARAAQNFAPADFDCANDLGRVTTVKLLPHLPGTWFTASDETRYAVFFDDIQPEKWEAKVKDGWRIVKKISGEKVFAREVAIGILAELPGQTAKSAAAPGLIVLENPNHDATLESH